MKWILFLITVFSLQTGIAQTKINAEDWQNLAKSIVNKTDAYIYAIKFEDIKSFGRAGVKNDKSLAWHVRISDIQNLAKVIM